LAYLVSDGSVTTKRKNLVVVSAVVNVVPNDVDFEVINLQNTSSNSSPVLVRTTGLFAKGQFPSNRYIQVTRLGANREPVPAQIDEVVHWSDGSIKFGVISFRDIDLAGSSSRQYVIQASESAPSTTPIYSLSDLTEDVKLTFTNVNLRTATATPTVTPDADLTASLLTAKSVSTRVTQIASGPVVTGWQIWQMANSGSGDHDHLKVYWYIWKWATGKTEVTAVTSLDWWEYAGTNGKQHMDYTAKLYNGSNLVYNYGDVHHHYHGQWAAVRMDNDDQHGLPHWIPGNQMPTIFVQRDKSYLVKTGLIPPFNPTITPTPRTYTNTSYTLMRSMDHTRAAGGTDSFGNPIQDIDQTGGWPGKGIWPEFDVYAFLKQTPADARNARVQSFAGLSFPRHFRTHALRQRPQDNASDISSVPLTFKLDGYKKVLGVWQSVSPSEYDFTSSGMPAPKHYNRNTGADPGYAYLPIVGMPADGMSGNSGPFTFRYPGSSHGVNYTLPHYLLTGYRYYLESSIDTAIGGAISYYGSCYGTRPNSKWTSCSGSEVWAGVGEVNGQERGIGWSNNILSSTAFVPDNDTMGPYLKKWNEHTANYFAKFIDAASSVAPLWNGAAYANAATTASIWQNSYVVFGSGYNYAVSEVAGYKSLTESSVRFLNIFAEYPAQLMLYYCQSRLDEPSTVSFLNEPFLDSLATFNADNTVTLATPTIGYPYSNNDAIYLSSGGGVPPPELNKTTRYYLVNVSGATANLAITPSGAPISFSPVAGVKIGIKIQSYQLISYAGQGGSYLPYAGHYIYEALAALEFGKFIGAATINDTYLTSVRNFLANSSNYSSNIASYPTSSISATVGTISHAHPPVITTPPVFTSHCAPTATQNSMYSCILTATDIENETLTFSIDTTTHTCAWLSLSGSTLSGIPNDDQVGFCTIGVKVTDGGNIVKQQIALSIINIAPLLVVPSSVITFSGLIGALVALTDEQVAANEEGMGIYSLVSPTGGTIPLCDTYGILSIHSGNGQVIFTPDSNAAHRGECLVGISFDDGNLAGQVNANVRLNINKDYSPAQLTLSVPSPAFSTILSYNQTQDVTYTLTNPNPGVATGIAVAAFLSGNFSVATHPCSSLAGGASCTFVLRFTSAALLTYADLVQVNYTNDNGAQAVSRVISFAGIDTLASTPPSSLTLATSVTGNLHRPTINVGGVFNGDTIHLYKDACLTEIASGVTTGTSINLTVNPDSFGSNHTYTLYANATDAWNNTSNCSSVTLDYTTPTLFTFDSNLAGDGGLIFSIAQWDRSYKVLKQNDGKIIMFGVQQGDINIMRLNSDGSLDNSFDTDGIKNFNFCSQRISDQETLFSTTSASRMGGLIQNDGKIVLIGSCYTYGTIATTDTLIVRVNSNGSLDTSFNGTGYLRVDISGIGAEDYGFAVGLASDGKYIIGGSAKNINGDFDLYVARINANGTKDSTYTSDGVSDTLFLDFSSGTDQVRDLTILANDSIIVSGRAYIASKEQILLLKLTSLGDLDTSFSGDGLLTTDFSQSFSFKSEDMIVQPDNKILVSGNTSDTKVIFIARFNSDGSIDNTFSGDGLALGGDPTGDSFGKQSSLVLHSNGELIFTTLSTSLKTKVFRLFSDGSFDKLFSSDGVSGSKGYLFVTSSLFSPANTLNPYDTLIDANGKLLIGGRIDVSGASDFGLIRMNLDYLWP
jgi:uncharacterized delta-60 repeat protein